MVKDILKVNNNRKKEEEKEEKFENFKCEIGKIKDVDYCRRFFVY